jgi:hypothetical protein
MRPAANIVGARNLPKHLAYARDHLMPLLMCRRLLAAKPNAVCHSARGLANPFSGANYYRSLLSPVAAIRNSSFGNGLCSAIASLSGTSS